MARSLLSQLLQVEASATYDDAVSSVHTGGVAEAQAELEGDLNVLRSLVKDLHGETNWYDTPSQTITQIADKYFIQLDHESGFETVSVTGGSTTAFDTAIKTITDHASGVGDSATTGVIVNTARAHKLEIRAAASNDAIDDGSGNEVYGRLSFASTVYTITFYSDISGTETAYSFGGATSIDLGYVAVSRKYQDLSWDRFLDFEYHDVSGISGTISDDSVVTDGFTNLLSGLTTQAAVNNKVDDLGSSASGEGASLIVIEDSAGSFTATEVEGALAELFTAIDNVSGWTKVTESLGAPVSSGVAHTVPGSATYTLASGANMDVHDDGQMLLEGAGNDYTEDTTTTVKFLYTVPTGTNLTYSIRK